jgi:hypothetical protein
MYKDPILLITKLQRKKMTAKYITDPNLNAPKSDKISRNTILYTAVAVLGLIVIILIAYFALSRDSHYTSGLKYLQAKNYNSALLEFQTINPDDKDFRMAQSKINYINGVKAFADSKYDEARIYFSKVDPSDEYYTDAKMMMSRIVNNNVQQDELQNLLNEVKKTKDTVIIREKTPVSKGNESGKEKNPPKKTDDEISKQYVLQVEKYMNQFESVYQSAASAGVDSKRNYVNNMSSIMSNVNSLSYNAADKNALVLDYKNAVTRWMSKRIEFINKMIAENSASVTNNTRSAKEEGDKLFIMAKDIIIIK